MLSEVVLYVWTSGDNKITLKSETTLRVLFQMLGIEKK